MTNVQGMIETCVQCGECVEVCPFYKATGNPSYGAMAKVGAARSLFAGEGLTEEGLKTLWLCTRCDRCVSTCPVGISVPDIVQSARAELRRRGQWPQKCSNIANAIIEHGSPMAAPPQDRITYLGKDHNVREKAEYLYVPGCWASVRLPEVARASFQLLTKAGLDITTLGEKERCCGLFLIDNGLMDEARELAEKNTLLLESTSAKTVITECPGCYDVYKRVYPALFREPNYEVIYIADILKDIVEHGNIEVKHSGRKVIYKDPCPLARRYDMTKAAREVLGHVAEVVEFEEHGAEAVCCGAPAGVKPLYPEVANELAGKLLKEASSKGVDQVGVGCPFCMHHMSGVQNGTEGPLRIRTPSQLMLESLASER
ncbi:(Fe-S)-binding protein [Methanomassiliicoccus luminyensis]|uniref:(Fe-S)-binding protein n=1 Tax=Methanomassiliicoccus luminyensis TaxID=1080712 RepID=UPI000370D7B5|nr:(Fe-S)-binding protein [Methanomassiliicoccus luminyensis]